MDGKTWSSGSTEADHQGDLLRLLSNVLYIGQVRHAGTAYPGEQARIVEESNWREVQKLLAEERAQQLTRKRTGMGGKERVPEAVAQDPLPERVPRIARLMALALKLEQMKREAVVSDYAVLAALGRVSRARVTQIMNLLNLAPDIQEQILFLKADTAQRQGICEQSIRRLSSLLRWNEQRAQWDALKVERGVPAAGGGQAS